jgi:hypothetical protein
VGVLATPGSVKAQPTLVSTAPANGSGVSATAVIMLTL